MTWATPRQPEAPPTPSIDGEPRRCLALLDEHPDSDGRAFIYARLLRGAARYTLYLRGGERDTAVREAAVADLRAARCRDPSLTVSATYFSPRFIQFFSIVTAE